MGCHRWKTKGLPNPQERGIADLDLPYTSMMTVSTHNRENWSSVIEFANAVRARNYVDPHHVGLNETPTYSIKCYFDAINISLKVQ